VTPGHALILRKNGRIEEKPVLPQGERRCCSFERIYFSRGTDRDIYTERKKLGELLAPRVLEAVDHDIENTVFSYIPNTAEVAFMGMMEALNGHMDRCKSQQIAQLGSEATPEAVENILQQRLRSEKIAVKDAKLRTFIADDASRSDLVAHVYDTTYGIVREGQDRLVVIDDSIVRGTTLRQSILAILDRLGPKQIVVVSSCPQIRYPDCYGIDMSKLKDFVAFRAAIELLKENQHGYVVEEVYRQCKAHEHDPLEQARNYVEAIYAPFSDEQISQKVAELLRPEKMQAELKVIFQSVDNLHAACPDHSGDWYFTGRYPTPGGAKVVNKSFVHFYEGSDERAY
jgi:amidophosphoribosyltransferase